MQLQEYFLWPKKTKTTTLYNNFLSSVLVSAAIYKSPTKKYSRSFVKLWLNHWCHMDYFNNTSTFLDLERVSCVALYGGQKACVLKMNKGLTSLKWHEGE